MSPWWALAFLVYLLWAWSHHGVYQDRIGSDLLDLLADLLAIPAWFLFMGLFWLFERLLPSKNKSQ